MLNSSSEDAGGEQAVVAASDGHVVGKRPMGVVPFVAALFGAIGCDQLSKWVAVHYLSGTNLPIVGRVAENTGIAFGFLAHLGAVTFPIAVLVTVGAIVYYLVVRGRDGWVDGALGLLVGGATSNLLDRLVHGHVIDFIDFRVWPVFNLADTAITCAVVILLWRAFRDDP